MAKTIGVLLTLSSTLITGVSASHATGSDASYAKALTLNNENRLGKLSIYSEFKSQFQKFRKMPLGIGDEEGHFTAIPTLLNPAPLTSSHDL